MADTCHHVFVQNTPNCLKCGKDFSTPTEPTNEALIERHRDAAAWLGSMRGDAPEESAERAMNDLSAAENALRTCLAALTERAEKAEAESAKLKDWQAQAIRGLQTQTDNTNLEFHRANATEAELARTREALKEQYDWMLREFAAAPNTGEAVTPDVRPQFNALCAALAKKEPAPQEMK